MTRAGEKPFPPTAGEVRYRWRLLRAGPLRLDGGSMFGVVPRILWSKLTLPDDLGRIELAHNCLLLEPVREESGEADRLPILIETGSGDKFDEKNRQIFGLSDRCIVDALAAVNVRPEDLRHVIVSHLHFDHAGGLTRRGSAGIEPTFPHARIIVQRREWDDATANSSVMTRTYLPENLGPVREQLHLVDSPAPFAPGYHPHRDELPGTSLEQRVTTVLPGIDVFRIPGHTWGQQAIRFRDDRGRIIVFSADLLPTIHHVGSAYNMAYDVEPYTSTVMRRWFLQAAADGDWVLVLDHEPGNPCQRVRADGKGWFMLLAEPEECP